MTRSCASAIFERIAAMRPSRIDTSPSTMSRRSFMVRMVPLRTRRDATLRLLDRHPFHGELGRVAAGDLPMFDGDELRENADGDFLRRHRADVEADWRVDARKGFRRHRVGGQRVVDARYLRAAADETEISQLARREGAQRLEIVGVAAP